MRFYTFTILGYCEKVYSVKVADVRECIFKIGTFLDFWLVTIIVQATKNIYCLKRER